MKFIIDCGNVKTGGCLQVSLSFIQYIINVYSRHEFFFIISENIYKQLDKDSVSKIKNYMVVNTTFTCLIPTSKTRNKIRKYIYDIKPDVVFTVFGPSYWGNYDGQHVIGFAQAWIVSPNTKAYTLLSATSKILMKTKFFIQKQLYVYFNGSVLVETYDIGKKLEECLGIGSERIICIPNSLPACYLDERNLELCYPDVFHEYHDSFKFLSLAHNYPHKNLQTIEFIAPIMESLTNHNFVFFVTFEEDEYSMQSDLFKKYTHNLGRIDVKDCPKYYKHSDALYMPTLLECFSVSYLESMFFNTPIATSHYSFAKEVCDNAAVYFDPFNYDNIAHTLVQLISSPDLKKQCKINSQRMMEKHISTEEKYDKYLDMLEGVGQNSFVSNNF